MNSVKKTAAKNKKQKTKKKPLKFTKWNELISSGHLALHSL